MEAELKSLEQKIQQFVELCQRLRSDNHQLRQQLASALSENRRLHDRMNEAAGRLEQTLTRIPEAEA